MSIYTDISLDFDKLHPITGDIGVIKDDLAIKHSVKNLILTDKNTIPLEREKGSFIKRLLFEQITPFTKHEARRYIEDILYRYEPRVEVEEVKLTDDNNQINISIFYKIKEYNKSDTLDIVLDKAR